MVLITKVLQFLEHPDASQKVSILVCDSKCNQTSYFKKILMKCQLIQFWKSVMFVPVYLYISVCKVYNRNKCPFYFTSSIIVLWNFNREIYLQLSMKIRTSDSFSLTNTTCFWDRGEAECIYIQNNGEVNVFCMAQNCLPTNPC